MKTLITSIVSLLIGLAVGWYAERRHSEHEKTQIVQQMFEGAESSDRERAVRAVRAIQLIESGEARQAVQILSSPVAYYYTLYTDAGSKEERRAETRAVIEQLAKTNQVVAARIAEFSTNSRIKTP
jgi:hypothetical protein